MDTATQIAGAPQNTAVVTLNITGMTCAACVSRLERVIARQPGVLAATVSLPAERAEVTFDPDRTGLQAVVSAIVDAGFGAVPAGTEGRGAADGDEVRRTLVTLLVSVALSVPLLAQMGLMLAGMPIEVPGWVLWALATPVQFWAGARFYRGAWYALRDGGANMDVLVALGTSAAYGLSVWQVLTSVHAHLDFEAAALVITLVIAGKWLEARARRETNRAIEALQALRPETARLLRDDGGEDLVPVAQVGVGDVVVVRPGERIPVDGVVIEGRAAVNEAMVTGEAMPQDRGTGARVTGGTLNLDGLLRVRTGAIGAESTLGRMIALVGHAQATKPHIQHLADVVSGRFAFLVAGVAALTFFGWFISTGSLEAAILPAVAVLVVACPCALGLATPAVIAVALGRAAREGILVRDAEALELAHEVGVVVFDKTGTLTDACPELADVAALDGDTGTLLALAAAVQRGSSHPIARAVVERASAEGAHGGSAVGAVSDFRVVAGRGVRGTVAGRELVLGNRALIDESGLEPESVLAERAAAFEAAGQAVVWIGEVRPMPQVLGVLAVADRLRPGAVAAVAALRRAGVIVVMLTGDAPAATASMMRRHWHAPTWASPWVAVRTWQFRRQASV